MIPFIFGSSTETTIPQFDSLHLVADLSQLLFLISLLFLDSLPQKFTDELSTSVCNINYKPLIWTPPNFCRCVRQITNIFILKMNCFVVCIFCTTSCYQQLSFHFEMRGRKYWVYLRDVIFLQITTASPYVHTLHIHIYLEASLAWDFSSQRTMRK